MSTFVEKLKSELDDLSEEEARLLSELARVQGEKAGLEKALRLSEEFPKDGLRGKKRQSQPKGAVKKAVLEVLREMGRRATSADVVQMLQDVGNPQNPATVRSVLSAAFRAGEISYEDGMYFLKLKNQVPKPEMPPLSPTEYADKVFGTDDEEIPF